MTKKHSLFGSPSSLYRHEKCPANVAYAKDMPEPPPSEYAKEGTVFHDYMEKCTGYWLQGDTAKVDEIVAECEYEDMPEHVYSSLEQLKLRWEKFKSKHNHPVYALELRVRLNEDLAGTSDVIFYGTNKETKLTDVVAIDYKYGKGVRVEAEENLQGIAYLLAAIETLQLTDIGIAVVVIAQVRLEYGWSLYQVTNLDQWQTRIVKIVDLVKGIYEEAYPIEEHLNPGSWCRFCKASGRCIAQQKQTLDVINTTAAELPIEERVRRLTLDEQVALFLKKKEIEHFLDAVALNLKCAIEAGVEHPLVKVVTTKGRRTWNPELTQQELVDALNKLGVANVYKNKLKGITDIEREIGKKRLDRLVKIGEGKSELVEASDKRESITLTQPKELPETEETL
jgi:hypothetical protein